MEAQTLTVALCTAYRPVQLLLTLARLPVLRYSLPAATVTQIAVALVLRAMVALLQPKVPVVFLFQIQIPVHQPLIVALAFTAYNKMQMATNVVLALS